MKAFYYYNRDNKKRPVITKCFITDGVTWSRGVAVCSLKDNPCKKVGKRIAYRRAMHAFFRQKTVVSEDVYGDRVFPKCEFMPELNDIEKKFMRV